MEDASEKRFAGLLTNGPAETPLPSCFTSTSLPQQQDFSYTARGEMRSQRHADEPPPAPPAPKPQRSGSYTRPAAVPEKVPQRSGSYTNSAKYVAEVMKGEHGIGLDLVKSSSGKAYIQKLKEMPDGVPNPAATCIPPVRPGYTITAVNGVTCTSFADTIKIIRSATGVIKLQLEQES